MNLTYLSTSYNSLFNVHSPIWQQSPGARERSIHNAAKDIRKASGAVDFIIFSVAAGLYNDLIEQELFAPGHTDQKDDLLGKVIWARFKELTTQAAISDKGRTTPGYAYYWLAASRENEESEIIRKRVKWLCDMDDIDEVIRLSRVCEVDPDGEEEFNVWINYIAAYGNGNPNAVNLIVSILPDVRSEAIARGLISSHDTNIASKFMAVNNMKILADVYELFTMYAVDALGTAPK